nr:hypothetical protein [Desulfobacula sp.]
MKIHLHKNAKTTPAQRAFIQADTALSTDDLARKLGVSPTTVRKWKKRTSVYDRPHVPQRLAAVLTPLQETLTVLLRLCLRSGLDDLHALVRGFIYPGYARSTLNRCLKRYGVSRLEPLYPPDHIHDHRGSLLYYSVIRLPHVFKGGQGEFLHIFLDCPTRLAQVEFTPDSYLDDPGRFMETMAARFPSRILGMIAGDLIDLSGRDTEKPRFHDAHSRFIHDLGKTGQPFYINADHSHSLTRRQLEKPGAPGPGNGVLNGEDSCTGFKTRLLDSLLFYNTRLCQRALRGKTPEQALQRRYLLFPGGFRSGPEQSLGTISRLEDPGPGPGIFLEP